MHFQLLRKCSLNSFSDIEHTFLIYTQYFIFVNEFTFHPSDKSELYFCLQQN